MDRPSIDGLDLVVLQHATEFGGSERHTTEFVRYLADQECTVGLIDDGSGVLGRHITRMPSNVSFVRTDLGTRGLSEEALRRWSEIFGHLRARRFLAVKPWYFDFDVALLKEIRKRYRTVYHLEHTLLPDRKQWSGRIHFEGRPRTGYWWYRDYFRLIRYRGHCDRVITVSDAGKRNLRDNALIPESLISVCRNGVDTSKWRRDEMRGRQFRERISVPDDAFLFGCVGRLAPEKGFDLAVEAFNAARIRLPAKKIALCIVGDGPQRSELRELAREQGGIVQFSGFVDDMVGAYSAIDSLLVTSHHEKYWAGESFGLVLAEGMSCGCQAIVAAHAGVEEVALDSESCILLRTRDPSAWADAMCNQADMEASQREAIRKGARAFAMKNHEQGRRFDLLFEELGFQSSDSTKALRIEDGSASKRE